MSDHFLSLIPEQPNYVPSTKAQSRALEMFRSFVPDALNVEACVTEHVEFIDQGENFEPKSGSWRPAAVWQIADIMRYGQETRGFAAATSG